MMNVVLCICAGLLLLATGYCEKSQTEQSTKTSPTPTPASNISINCNWEADVSGNKPTGLQKFLIGKWEGREWSEQQPVMSLTFQEDGIVRVNYSVKSPAGRESSRPYRITNSERMNICGYPDNFTIIKHGADEFELRSDSKEAPTAIELIYVCRFKRIKS